MQRSLMLSLVCGLAGVASTAFGAQIIMNKSEAVSAPRTDPGTGVCASVVKFNNQPTPVSTVDEATALLEKGMGDPSIIGRTSRLLQSTNLSIGTGSEGDLRAPMYNDEIFPYCNNPMSMPMGVNDYNIAMRIRGYLNVTTPGPTTLAMNCDDGCQLRLGNTRQVVTTADERSPQLTGRRARQVVFQDPGLYPFEIVYYQNATTGYLECSRVNATPFGDDVAVSNVEWGQQAANFKPLAGAELYSAITGVSSACQECSTSATTPVACASGSYCGDGICQTCNVADHCGASCEACPAGKRLCQSGKCVECSSDDQCTSSGRCDVAAGVCSAPTPCTESEDCKGAGVCRPEGFCGAPPKPCTAAADCQSSQSCTCEDGSATCAQKVCLKPPTPCASSSECSMGYTCDSASRLCKIDYRLYGGGISCSASDAPNRGPGLALLAMLGLLLAVAMRARRSRALA